MTEQVHTQVRTVQTYQVQAYLVSQNTFLSSICLLYYHSLEYGQYAGDKDKKTTKKTKTKPKKPPQVG